MPSHQTPPRQRTRNTPSTPSKPKTPLGAKRTLSHSRSNGALAQQFVDRHSTTYAHLYEHPDEIIRREKLEAEERRLEDERRAGRDMRERMMRLKLDNSENQENEAGDMRKGRGSWRPLSLVAKRQQVGLGHSRSASHQIPSTFTAPTIRSVSDTPTSSLARENATPQRVSSRHADRTLEVVVERDRSDSPLNTPSDECDTTMASEPKSTYSWATSFSGETSELRTTATYLPQSDQTGALITQPEEEVLDTPEKVKRRRKRIVAIAHTVRQLEGVGSREAEDPAFYGELVKAWNDRPGFKLVAKPYITPTTSTWADGPPALLPPPNLPEPGHYSPYTQSSDPNHSPAFTRHFGSPPTPQLFTPALGFAGPSTAVGYPPMQEVCEYDEDASDNSGELRGRSLRYSYASALHDLALEDAEVQSKPRWSGAWEGWGAGPVAPPHETTPMKRVEAQLPPGASNDPQPALAETPTKDASWGLGFMSAWWADRPSPSHTPQRQDFHMGECRPHQLPTPPRSRQGDHVEELDSTPGHQTSTASGDQSMTLSGVSTPSFGMRINGEAEWRWARPEIVTNGRMNESPTKYTSPPPLPLPLPHTQHPSWLAPADLPPLPTLDSTTSTIQGENEFPFSSHCRPPSCSIPSTSSSLVSVPSEIQHLRQERESSRSLVGLASGSFPSDRTLRPRMLRESTQEEQGLLARRQVRPLVLGELLNPYPIPIPVSEAIHDHPLPHLQSQELLIERQSSISQLDTTTPNTLLSPSMSQIPTPTSIQTHFLPPRPSPITPTGDALRRAIHPISIPHPSSDPSSSPCELSEPNGDTRPVPQGRGIVDMRGQRVRHSRSTTLEAEMESGGYRDNTPSVVTAVAVKRQGFSSMLLFWLGFIMPWCWIFGGWPVGDGSVDKLDEEKGAEVNLPEGWVSRWLYHPDPWARRCRLAAVSVLPLVAVSAVVAVIVLAIMRGR